MEQMNLFADCVAYQEEVRDPSRIAETLNRVIMQAHRASAPAQINIPRDFWTQVIDIEMPKVVEFERPSGGKDALAQAADLLSNAKFPVILNWRWRCYWRRDPCICCIGGTFGRTSMLWLPAQRCIPWQPPVACWPTWLQRFKGWYGIDF